MGKLTKDEAVNFIIRAVFIFFSELLGTFALMFVACMGCVLSLDAPGDLTGIALSFGFAVIAGIEIGSHISGGHINPIVTMAGIIFKKVSLPMSVVYLLGQLSGSLLGIGLLKILTPNPLKEKICVTVPNPDLSLVQAAFVEFLTSSVLVLVVCSQWDPRNNFHESTSVKIGLTVACLVYASNSYTGCGINPARSFGPAVWNNSWKDHWIYWVGPLVAGIIWPVLYLKVFVELGPKDNKVKG